nr:MAG TPA: DNA-packaging protein [Bacteriophage sp.]
MSKVKYPDSEYSMAITCVEDMPAVAADIVRSYCDRYDIDERDIYPSIWSDIITELNIKLFNPCNKLLKKDNALYNDYNIDKVIYVYEYIYKRLCNNHCQEISQKGFCDMIGIGKQTLYEWESGALSSQRSDLRQKIMDDNEESLFNLMKDRRNNPMKILPKLNKVHHWNMPGVRQESRKEALTADALPQLNCTKSIDNSESLPVVEQ